MKLFFVFILLTVFPQVALQAQSRGDQAAIDLIQKGDMFEIQEKYPSVAPQVETLWIKQMLGVLYYSSNNRADSAHEYIDSLMIHHQQDIGFENISGMILIKGNLYAQEGEYRKGIDVVRNFLDQVTSLLDTMRNEDYRSYFADTTRYLLHRSFIDLYGPLYDLPTPSLQRPNRDVEVPFVREKAGRDGSLIRIPVQLNGKTHWFILDTGASASYVHERFAREAGLKIVGSTDISSAMLGEVEGKFAALDSLVVGDIVFRNPVIFVGPENRIVDSMYYIDALLGADFLHLLAEMQIDNEKSMVRFPLHPSPVPASGKNMIFNDRCFRVKTFFEQKPLYFHLDTGDSSSSLNGKFYEEYTSYVNSVALADSAGRVVGNELKYIPVKALPEFPLTLGGKTVAIKKITVFDESDKVAGFQDRSGSLGQQFVKAFRTLTFNFKDCFLDGEPY